MDERTDLEAAPVRNNDLHNENSSSVCRVIENIWKTIKQTRQDENPSAPHKTPRERTLEFVLESFP